MFTLLILFVIVVALYAVFTLATGGPPFARRRGRTITIVERDAPRETIVEREYEV